jgi:hypothetical protein
MVQFRDRTPGLGTALVAGLVILLGCRQDQSDPTTPTTPEFATTPSNQTLTVKGFGTGSGTVTAPAYGATPALSCSFAAGISTPASCTSNYAWKTQVTLTATPSQGSIFAGWGGECAGNAKTCVAKLGEPRTVTATFYATGTTTYALTVTGGGTGNGAITTQTGLSPAINCTVTAGSAGSTGCSARYPNGAQVTLTPKPASKYAFTGWSGSCTGTGPCTLAMTANRSAKGGFADSRAATGSWASPQSTPVVGVHLIRLRSGKTLFFGHQGEPQLWQGPGGAFTQIVDPNCNDGNNCDVFCSGHAFLADGTVLAAGGHDVINGNDYGVTQASLFDGTAWQATASMRYRRWYPTLVTLPNGDVLALAGNQSGVGTPAPLPERYSATARTWTTLTGANAPFPLYPRAFVEPKNGRVLVADGAPQWIDPTGSGSKTAGPPLADFDREYGPAVMLDSKVFYIGGGGGTSCPGNLPKSSVEMIDLAAATPTWRLVKPMSFRRRHAVATILADGTVLVTGGTSACGFNNEAGAVYVAELYDPATGIWTRQASARVVRTYHATAMLLPDGRVVSTGSGDGGGGTDQRNYEIFSPGYLFKGARPTYTLARTDLHYGQAFTVSTPDAARIRKVNLIRLASSTHAFDMGQRLNTVAFAVGSGSLTLTPPASGRIAPPGPYYLIVVDDKGVPSVAKTVLLTP